MLDFFFKHGISKEDIPSPPYDYDFLLNLTPEKYPLYLEKIFYYQMGKKLNLSHPKTFNEKIQWLKLYDNIPLKRNLTDKILVRDWIRKQIGEEYLKPILLVCKTFDEIDFSSLPNKFIIKTNHGSKWNYKIKNKEQFLSEKRLVQMVRDNFNSWLNVSFFPWVGFEMQYKGIEPKILIEELLIDDEPLIEYEIYCFNGQPQLYQKVIYSHPVECCVYEKDFSISDICFNTGYRKNTEVADSILKEAVELSRTLAKDFKLVRVDWLRHDNKLYFNEMTFTPFSGFFKFSDESHNLRLGKMLDLKK
ncbi:MAG: hypothetical protein IJY61_01105 [Candidatus Gastranaerophilales bacterium]|nr:hypothetical protein [Candidatus Gastranaerophilales bacterium]